MKAVTCILTSCGRFDLLRKTLESFFKYNTYDIKEFWIYDDSNISGTSISPENPQHAIGRIQQDFPFIKWSVPGYNRGQIAALDWLWQVVETPYAFTMEDDWEFTRSGFIEDSMSVLEKEPKVLQCWLHKKDGAQPVELKDGYMVLKTGGNLWAGTRFSPALKRKDDYDLIAPFSKHTTWNPEKPWKSEADISKVYHKLGFTGAILPQTYIRHIGEGRHVGP